MDMLSPLTTLIEWVWCAAQVGASYVELVLFLTRTLSVLTIGWHVTRWQKKMLLALHCLQTQISEMEESRISQAEAIKEILNISSRTETINEVLTVANEVGALKKQLQDAMTQLSAQAETVKEILSVNTKVGVLKQQLLDVLSQLASLKSVSPELASLHKLIGTVTGDCAKLGGMFNRLTETHGLVIHLPNSQYLDAALDKIQKNLEDYADKVQKSTDRKLEDLLEKTAVLRAVFEQKHDKQLVSCRDPHGHTVQQVSDAISLLRGLAPAIPEIKRVADMVTMGRGASTQAQQTLQQNTETAQAVEDRLIRIEPLVSGLADQTADLETKLEAIQLPEIMARLPKLPTRKPPTERVSAESASSGGTNTGANTCAGQPTHPTTPPTTLGPTQTTNHSHGSRSFQCPLRRMAIRAYSYACRIT